MRNAFGSVGSVLVLGGTSEIAAATARALVAGRTRRVILGVRSPERAVPLKEELEGMGAGVEVVEFDAEDTARHPTLVEDVFAGGGDIDLVLVAFGVLSRQDAGHLDRDEALKTLQVNAVGAVSVLVPVVERLRAQGHGVIVVLSSVAAERPRQQNFVYGASKAALDAFAQGLGDWLVSTGVEVLVVRPGFVHTKMTEGLAPAPLAATPEAVAEAIVTGLRRRSHTVWAPPTVRYLMAVLRHLPRPIFRRLS